MSTKSLLIDNATMLFQQKGYKSVGLNELLSVCNITKGALYHHFPNGKEELLITCLNKLNEVIMTDIHAIFNAYPTTETAMIAMLDKLVRNLETDGTITGYAFSSIVSEMATMSESVRTACLSLYENIQHIYSAKLVADGYSAEAATEISLFMSVTIEGAMMLCLTQQSADPLKTIANLFQRYFYRLTNEQ